MNTTILIVAVAYIAVVALVLRIFHYMRDKNVSDLDKNKKEIKPKEFFFEKAS